PGDFTSDAGLTRSFLGGALRAPKLRWVQLPNAGVDHPVFARLLERGGRLSTGSGAAPPPAPPTVVAAPLARPRRATARAAAQRRGSRGASRRRRATSAVRRPSSSASARSDRRSRGSRALSGSA